MKTQQVIVSDGGEILRAAVMPFGNGAGHVTDKILVNEAGTEYHCADCDYTAEGYGSVFAHRRVHVSGTNANRGRNKKVAPLDALRAQAAGLVEAIDTAIEAEIGDLSARAEKAEARAKAAEKALNTLRRALRGVEQV